MNRIGYMARGFWIGATAGTFSIFLSFLLRILLGGLFVPELAAQTLFSITPGEIESQIVETIGAYAKYSALTGAIFVNIALYGFLGSLLSRLRLKFANKDYIVRALGFSLLAYLILLLASVIFLAMTEIATQPTSIEAAAVYLLPAQLIFGFVLVGLSDLEFGIPSAHEKTPEVLPKMSRRRRLLIRAAAASAVASIVLFYGLDLFFPSAQPTPTSEIVKPPGEAAGIFADPMLVPFVGSEVTVNDQFYRVDVNVSPPTVNTDTWKLTVHGLVDNPLALSYAELKSMETVTQYSTLQCVSNVVGGDLISNALWKGVRLRNLLEKAQASPKAAYVVFECADGYDVGIPIQRAILDGTIMAYEMNGVPLPQDHGRPLRAIVPGLYGMMNAKWITAIQVVDKVHQGFWQRRGWANNAEYQTQSTIVIPGESSVRRRFAGLVSSNVLAGNKAPVAGIAFSGDRGILKVEISTDGGKTWEAASLKDPLSGYTWVLWAAEWNPPAKGTYEITVRAIDMTGNVQIARFQNPFPSGATGYHMVDITVENSSSQ